jgi:hypothetical protein
MKPSTTAREERFEQANDDGVVRTPDSQAGHDTKAAYRRGMDG